MHPFEAVVHPCVTRLILSLVLFGFVLYVLMSLKLKRSALAVGSTAGILIVAYAAFIIAQLKLEMDNADQLSRNKK